MDFDAPEGFATGAVGKAGDRAFYLQAAQGPRIASVMLEREQVAILADRVMAVIDELERRGLAAIDAGPAAHSSVRPLEEPIREEFRVGTMTIAWDDDVDELVIEARSMTFDAGAGEVATREIEVEEIDEDEIPDDAPIGPDVLRVHLTPSMAQRFARDADTVVGGNRPACPFCGEPLEPTGHLCRRPQGGEYIH